jgi:hypothetical protein
MVQRPYLEKSHHKKRFGGVAYGVVPEFKPQCQKKKRKKEGKRERRSERKKEGRKEIRLSHQGKSPSATWFLGQVVDRIH